MTNDELLARAQAMLMDAEVGNASDRAVTMARLVTALHASEEEVAKLRDLNTRAEGVIKGYLPTVKELEEKLAAAENVIRKALDVVNLEPSYNTESNIARAHDFLSSYKPEEGKN